MGTYEKQYAKNEFNFQVGITTAAATNDMILRVNSSDVELEIWGSAFAKIDGTGTEVQLTVDVNQLVVAATGGVDAVINTDYLRANKDLRKTDLITGVSLLKDPGGDDALNVDLDEYLNIYRCCGVATKSDVQNVSSGVSLFKYTLKRNTDYLIRSTKIAGANNTSRTFLYGVLREL